ncbi:MAG TPA: single-stranded DNA-binding protein [Intrasporangium sp.]|jgi:single-strand DNA-binding protein|uniref:single-stranded DNA-binding protein n=1 Tax=Intrasporangium sp. TaxID=1925024 RepID=UPI002F9591DA
MNETRITVHGNVTAAPVERTSRNGNVFTTFRVASTPRRRTADGTYVDLDTNFFSVISWNALAANTAAALQKGQPVIVEGNLTIKSYLTSDGQPRTDAEIEAQHIGHDLVFGRASFERLSRAAALGVDRNADPAVRHAMAETNGVSIAADAHRPANVDANGEAFDGPVEGGGSGPVQQFGDPDTDEYHVEETPAA